MTSGATWLLVDGATPRSVMWAPFIVTLLLALAISDVAHAAPPPPLEGLNPADAASPTFAAAESPRQKTLRSRRAGDTIAAR